MGLRTSAELSNDWLERSLAVAMEAIPTIALIVDEHGSVRYANELASRSGIDAHASVALDGFHASPIIVGGYPKHWLLRARDENPTAEALARVIVEWRLSKRQAEVMACLMRGDANKTIAARLGCAVATVEVHVTALLRKASAESRADVVAKAWRA